MAIASRVPSFIAAPCVSVSDLIASDLNYDELLQIKARITGNRESFSPIIVIERIESERYEVTMESTFYEDTREFLVTLS